MYICVYLQYVHISTVCAHTVDTLMQAHICTHSYILCDTYEIVSDFYACTVFVYVFVFLCVWYTGFTGHGLL